MGNGYKPKRIIKYVQALQACAMMSFQSTKPTVPRISRDDLFHWRFNAFKCAAYITWSCALASVCLIPDIERPPFVTIYGSVGSSCGSLVPDNGFSQCVTFKSSENWRLNRTSTDEWMRNRRHLLKISHCQNLNL